MMATTLSIILVLLGAAATLSAFGGETWIREDQALIQRIIARGWVSILCLVAAVSVGIWKELLPNPAAGIPRVVDTPYFDTQSRDNYVKSSSQPGQLEIFAGDTLKYQVHGDAEINPSPISIVIGDRSYPLDPRGGEIIVIGIPNKPLQISIRNPSNISFAMKMKVLSAR